ncbi:Golgi to ER traffic protein 4 homolog [Pectinophora gossypiella]|uniref:Golgi to ER traffic protein 4 homolog n=1 Tax=Pectinophora gossypiella TaxID=13191 RepID=A0A1E1WNR8_PECGO|nr:Golgi to ER traffic protein 4 homolog [Pectinophora gossypiella]
MATRGERGVGRVLDKLEASVNSGQYYEAHQMYRTLYFRYLSQKKYADLLNLLYKGSTLLLQRDQQGSGADLAILLIDVLTKSDTKPCEEWIDKLAKLFEIMNSSIPERETFLTNSVKWSMDSNKKGHPLLHKRIAEVYWKEKKYTAAHRHFLHSSDGNAYANMLIELHTTKGLKSEIDMFIAQAVLQILCLRNIQMATEAFNKYTGSHPRIRNDKGPPYLFPLLNFLWFLLKAIEQKQSNQFKILRNWYAISIKRDPNYSVYLDNIGRIWFGIEIPQDNKNTGSLFGGLIKSIIGDAESSDDEGDYLGASASAPDLD